MDHCGTNGAAVCNYLSPNASDHFSIIVFTRQLMNNYCVQKTVLGTLDSKMTSIPK